MSTFTKDLDKTTPKSSEQANTIPTILQNRLAALIERLTLEHYDLDKNGGASKIISAPDAQGRHRPGNVACCKISNNITAFVAAEATAGRPVQAGSLNLNPDTKALHVCGSGGDFSGNVLQGIPPGFIMDFAGATVPAGWLICDGGQEDIVDYPVLAAILGNTWNLGVTPPSGKFIKPLLTGRIRAGEAPSHLVGSLAGYNTATLVEENLPSHSHTLAKVYNEDDELQEDRGVIISRGAGSVADMAHVDKDGFLYSQNGNRGADGGYIELPAKSGTFGADPATAFDVIQPTAYVKVCIKY